MIDVASFVLETQERMLRAALSNDKAISVAQRSAVTKALAKAFAELVERLAPPVIAEIGAHEASFARQMAGRLPQSRVIAFEPHPGVFAQFSGPVTASGVEYVRACVTDYIGKATLQVPLRADATERRSMASLLSDSRSRRFQNYEVEAVTLDGALDPDCAKPSALWIDVEGAIGPVLAGARRTLANCLALYAEVETVPRWPGQMTAGEVTDVLAGYGLKPVLRDIQREASGVEWQHNALYLRADML